ncbi:MAG: hypothetical protein DRQ52_08725, partial [Gammaproteobacteria bacterium]
MSEFANFHFLRPEFLWLLAPLAILLVLGLRRSNSGDWQSRVDRELLPYLLEGSAQSPRYGAVGLLGLVGLLAISAIAGPAWRELPQPLFRNQSGIVLALDLSRSMDATDLKPNRLSRTRFKINDIINTWPDGQIALVVYAADAFIVTPLTDDRATLTLQLPALGTDLVPVQGSNPKAAIILANQLLHQAGLVNGEIWLLTDGIPDNVDIDDLINAAGDHPVSVLGIGTPEGAPIATSNGFLKDPQGNIVLPKLKEAALRQLADGSGGRYARLNTDSRDIDYLLNSATLVNRSVVDEQEDRRADLWQEEGPWLLLPVLLFAAFAFRRGYLVVLLAIMITPRPALAVSWQELWQTPDQQAQKAFDRGDNPAAIDSFSDPRWQAAARYRQGDYEGAAETLGDQTGATSTYNRGNSKAQMGDYQGALDDYDQVLSEQPDNEDARFNRDLVEKLLEQQQQQQQQQDQDQESSDDSDDKDSESDSENDQQNQDSSESEQDSPPEDKSGDQSEDNQKSPPDQNDPNPSDDSNDDKPEVDKGQPEEPEPIDEDGQPEEPPSAPTAESPPPMDDETRQATEQWLRRIPDDPGGLLRRKFLYQ